MKTTAHIEARKEKARQKFLRQVAKARARTDLTPEALEIYVEGLSKGYGCGLMDGVRLGIEASEEISQSYAASGVGIA